MNGGAALPTRAGNPNSYWTWDVALMGGLSIVVCLGAWAFMDTTAPVTTVASLAFALAFLVNHPHFLASYMLLYGDFGPKIFRNIRYFWAGVLVPILLGAWLVACLVMRRGDLLGYAVTAMFFLVGWHYVKQVFGCLIVTSVQRKIFYKPWERRLMLANLFTLWSMSWLGGHIATTPYDFFGITYPSLGLDPRWHTASFWAVGLTFLAVAAMHVRKYVEEGVKPSPPGMAAIVALYVWYLPLIYHPGFFYLVPFFHSLQYLAFVWALKRRQVEHGLEGMEPRSWRAGWIKRFGGFAMGALALGALSFEIVPKALDSRGWFAGGAMGVEPFIVVFNLFINIHHYFIDNVIWRSDNETVRQYLFQTSAPKAVAVRPPEEVAVRV